MGCPAGVPPEAVGRGGASCPLANLESCGCVLSVCAPAQHHCDLAAWDLRPSWAHTLCFLPLCRPPDALGIPGHCPASEPSLMPFPLPSAWLLSFLLLHHLHLHQGPACPTFQKELSLVCPPVLSAGRQPPSAATALAGVCFTIGFCAPAAQALLLPSWDPMQ